jgi:hypothetical protein
MRRQFMAISSLSGFFVRKVYTDGYDGGRYAAAVQASDRQRAMISIAKFALIGALICLALCGPMRRQLYRKGFRFLGPTPHDIDANKIMLDYFDSLPSHWSFWLPATCPDASCAMGQRPWRRLLRRSA